MKDPNEVTAIMFGLDGSGKTTILFKKKLGEVVSTIPTIGYNVETVTYKGAKITIWDIGGQEKLRSLWKNYLAKAQAIIYVVDSSNKDSFEKAAEELNKLLSIVPSPKPPLLVLANKQDLPNARSVAEITEALGLHLLAGFPWYIQATTAMTGDSINEGIDWLVKQTIGEIKPATAEEGKSLTSKEHMINQLQAIDQVLKVHEALIKKIRKVFETDKSAHIKVNEDGSLNIH